MNSVFRILDICNLIAQYLEDTNIRGISKIWYNIVDLRIKKLIKIHNPHKLMYQGEFLAARISFLMTRKQRGFANWPGKILHAACVLPHSGMIKLVLSKYRGLGAYNALDYIADQLNKPNPHSFYELMCVQLPSDQTHKALTSAELMNWECNKKLAQYSRALNTMLSYGYKISYYQSDGAKCNSVELIKRQMPNNLQEALFYTSFWDNVEIATMLLDYIGKGYTRIISKSVFEVIQNRSPRIAELILAKMSVH